MAGSLSSLNLIASAGIIGSVGGVPLAANSLAVSNLSSYNNLPIEVAFANVKSAASAAITLMPSTKTSLYNLAGNIFPALTNAVPTSYIGSLGNTTLSGFSGVVTTEINNIMGNGDLGKFSQVFSLADGYRVSTNKLINSAINANNIATNATYSSQDNTSTGGMSQISLAFEVFGAELLALGYSIDFSNIADFGSPQSLLRQIYTLAGQISSINTALLNAGISEETLNNLTYEPMPLKDQKIAYDVMTTITGSRLNQVLFILKVTTPGLTSMADLLNPVKMFPKSFNTLTAPTSNGLRGIYINSSGAVNTKLETILPSNVLAPIDGYATNQITYAQLKQVVPPDQALASKAIQAGLEQLKSLFGSTAQLLGASTRGLESNKGLSQINALTSPLPASVSSYFGSYGGGTGYNGTLLLADLIGTAGGWVVNGNVATTITTLSAMTAANAFDTLTSNVDGVYTVMANCIAGDYNVPDMPSGYHVEIPIGMPGAGIYTSEDVAFTGPGAPGIGLIPAAYSLIANIVAVNTSNVTLTNTNWANISAQLVLEASTQANAKINFANLVPNSSIEGFATNIGKSGLDTAVGGPCWFFESIANVATIGGEAIIASMREERNQARLAAAGIGASIIVSDEGLQQQISPTPGQYSVAEAASQKII